jgi:hypothetical protein
MKKALADFWEFVSWEDPAADHILIVAGCSTACVESGQFKTQIVHWVNSEASGDSVITKLTEIHTAN